MKFYCTITLKMKDLLESRLLLFSANKRFILNCKTNFTEKIVKEMLNKHGIEVHYIATYSMSNEQTERYVSTVLTTLICEIL